MSWKKAALLGVVIFAVFAVAIPLGVEWWVHDRKEDLSGPGATIVAPVVNNLFDIRFMLPMRVVASVAALILWVIALWKVLGELRGKSESG